MAKILITSLGKDNYKKTCYKFNNLYKDNSYLSSEILLDLIKPDRLYVIGTEESAWQKAEHCFSQFKINKLQAPSLKKEKDWWLLLQMMTGINMKENDEVYLDVTHGFRSMPIFSLLAIIYFENVFGASTKGIYYGMWEGKHKENVNGSFIDVTPIIDLSPFIKLKDWIEGLSLFENFGDANLLAELFDNDFDNIKDFSKNLRLISNAFGLNYVRDITIASENFRKLKHPVSFKLQEKEHPANLIIDKLFNSLTRFSESSSKTKSVSELHRAIIQWYFTRRRYTQCIILINELVLTWLLENLNNSKIYNYEYRQKVRIGIARSIYLKKRYPVLENLISFTREVSNRRNRSGHAKIDRKKGIDLSNAPNEVEGYINKIDQIMRDKKLINFLDNKRDELNSIIEAVKIK